MTSDRIYEMICIECPNGCRLQARQGSGGGAEDIEVTGNRCRRGREFAAREVTNPMRTLCSTVRTTLPGCPVLPVRLSGEIPKSRIFDAMAEINQMTVTEPVARGQVIVSDLLGLGVDLIAASGVLAENVN